MRGAGPSAPRLGNWSNRVRSSSTSPFPYTRGDLVARLARRGPRRRHRAHRRTEPGQGAVPAALAAVAIRQYATPVDRGAVGQPTIGWFILGDGSTPIRRPPEVTAMGNATCRQSTPHPEPEHELFRQSYRAFLDKHVAPYHDQWERTRSSTAASGWKAGKQGYLGMARGVQRRHRTSGTTPSSSRRPSPGATAAWASRCTTTSSPALLRSRPPGAERRWLPQFCHRRDDHAIAMTEPGTPATCGA